MRIVYVLTSLAVGGAERQVTALAARMALRGHAVALLVLRPESTGEWTTDICTVHLNMSRDAASVKAGMVRARRFLADFRPQLVHSHCFHANLAMRLLRLTLRGPVMVSTIHNVYEGGWQRMLAYRLTDGLSCRTTAVSEAVARRFVRLHAVSAKKCMVVRNAIELAALAPHAERRRRERDRMQAGDDFIWLAAGRIAPAKDYPTLLRAFAQVCEQSPDARLWIAGAARPGAMEPLQALATDLGLTDSVHWLGLRRDLPALLDAADGFAMSSAWEGMPLALAEAMAMEKPVVATSVGGVAELLGEGDMAIPAGNPRALADAMLAIMRQPLDRRQALGHLARERIVEEFNMEKRAGEWEALYEALLKAEKTATPSSAAVV